MMCSECRYYECIRRTPLGGCEQSAPGLPIIEEKSIYDFGLAGIGIMEAEYQKLSDAAQALVDAVERYVKQRCLRSELLMKTKALKDIIGG